MSGRGGCKDKCIAHTVAFLLWCPLACVPEAMPVCKFTPSESKDLAKQMVVRRAYAKAIGAQPKAPPTASVNAMTIDLSVLPLTNHTATAAQLEMHGEDGNVIVVPRPKPNQIGHTPSGMQQWQINKFDASKHAKRAFKRGTSWLTREKETKGIDGLSALKIAK
jgi:hypothetical protein